MEIPKNAPQFILDQIPEDLRPKKVKPRKPSVPRSMSVEFIVPCLTRSEANTGGKLRDKIARKTAIKRACVEVLGSLGLQAQADRLFPTLAIRLTRLGGGRLDSDNLQRALKPVRDVVAKWLHRDDGDPTIDWEYTQAASWTEGIMIRVSFLEQPR